MKQSRKDVKQARGDRIVKIGKENGVRMFGVSNMLELFALAGLQKSDLSPKTLSRARKIDSSLDGENQNIDKDLQKEELESYRTLLNEKIRQEAKKDIDLSAQRIIITAMVGTFLLGWVAAMLTGLGTDI